MGGWLHLLLGVVVMMRGVLGAVKARLSPAPPSHLQLPVSGLQAGLRLRS